ncbi:site-specific integrase [uncultured Alistipes sp.]|uniref:site-specific integrase n=1 Tax=uncultured Alistipes sp. TaxID=538949 RepID=UPI0026298B11|nr:site-specific integrase [uncultured Alistipes sp.]
MASVKVKFRASTVAGKEGSLYFQIILNRKVFRIRTDYKIHASEWDERLAFRGSGSDRTCYLDALRRNLLADLARLERNVAAQERSGGEFSFEQVFQRGEAPKVQKSFFRFMQEQIARLEALNRIRTSETYATALHSFSRFRKFRDIRLDAIDSELMSAYEAELKMTGVSKNTSSFYMRILRAVYNRAVEQRLTPQRHPFKHVYTGIDKTVKRAVSAETVRKIRSLDLSAWPKLDYARDMFLLSFYTRGMSFVDMVYLRKNDLKGGILTYRRKKTGQQLSIRWESCMQEIVDKYPDRHPDYLLPILRSDAGSERSQYKNVGHLINRNLKKIGQRLQLPVPLTLYVARHTWASVARSQHIPLSVISEGMGHDSETTTQIYLASLDTAEVDRANRMVIDLIASRFGE